MRDVSRRRTDKTERQSENMHVHGRAGDGSSSRWLVLDPRAEADAESSALESADWAGVVLRLTAAETPTRSQIDVLQRARSRGSRVVVAWDEAGLSPLGASAAADVASRIAGAVGVLRPDVVVGLDWLAAPAGADPVTADVEAGARTWRAIDAALVASGDAGEWSGLLPADPAAQDAGGLDLVALRDLVRTVFVDLRGFEGVGRAARARDAARRVAGVFPDASRVAVLPGAFDSSEPHEPLELSTCCALAEMHGVAAATTAVGWAAIDGVRDSAAVAPSSAEPPDIVVAWSPRARREYGREWSELLVDAPYRGIATAFDRLAVDFSSVPLDTLAADRLRATGQAPTLVVLPNVAVIEDADANTIREFVRNGGSLLATGDTARFLADGSPREMAGLADVLGVKFAAPADRLRPITAQVRHGMHGGALLGRLKGPATEHSYLRLCPELARETAGPHVPREPVVVGERHEILDGFENTDLIAFGGLLPEKTSTPLLSARGRPASSSVPSAAGASSISPPTSTGVTGLIRSPTTSTCSETS
jgi:hypothetical protein